MKCMTMPFLKVYFFGDMHNFKDEIYIFKGVLKSIVFLVYHVYLSPFHIDDVYIYLTFSTDNNFHQQKKPKPNKTKKKNKKKKKPQIK